ncbi:hypothetical protein [Andreprevotia sp. IGB-42]|uniref:hypothetical protein n=1 Tax=Andreprevotia sp. IGB-42 TaxID=2497473 RepID=UPI00135A1604|nr:hypothetical protein [Andreprevotia sp. IGB-42]
MHLYRCLLIGIVSVCLTAAGHAKGTLTDEQIKQAIIKESIDAYPGNCPCPYNAAKNGSACGKRSAYSRPNGYAPICYAKDVTAEMVKEWKGARRSE